MAGAEAVAEDGFAAGAGGGGAGAAGAGVAAAAGAGELLLRKRVAGATVVPSARVESWTAPETITAPVSASGCGFAKSIFPAVTVVVKA